MAKHNFQYVERQLQQNRKSDYRPKRIMEPDNPCWGNTFSRLRRPEPNRNATSSNVHRDNLGSASTVRTGYLGATDATNPNINSISNPHSNSICNPHADTDPDNYAISIS